MSLEKTLRAIILLGLFIVPFIVLIVADSMFFPYITGKNFTFRLIVEIIFSAWVLLALMRAEYRPRRSWVLISTSAFIAIVALADIFGANPSKSIWSNFERMEGLVTFVHLLAYALVWGTVLNTEKLRIWFWRVSLGASVIISIHALLQLASGTTNRLESTLGNPIYLAVYVLFHIFIAGILALNRNTKHSGRFILSGIIVLELIVLYLTATRGATLGVLVGGFIAALGIAITERQNVTLRRIAAGIVLAIVVLVSGFFAIKDSNFVQESKVLKRFAHISLTEGTVMARSIVWGMAIDGVKERPLIGWGQESFNYVFNKYYDPRMYDQEQWFDRTHNIVFDTLITSGILGLLAYVAIFISILIALYRTELFNVEQKWLVVGMIAAYGIHNLTVFDQIVSFILFFSVLAWMYTLESQNLNTKDQSIVLPNSLAKTVGMPLAVVLAAALIWSINASAYHTNKTLLSAVAHVAQSQALANVGRTDEAIDRANMALAEFKMSADYHSYANQEVYEHLNKSTVTLVKQEWVPDELKQQYFDAAVQGLKIQEEIAPNDARFPFFLSRLYALAGLYDMEQAELDRARELSPNKQTIILMQGINATHLHDNEAALALFKLAYELETSDPQSAKIYAQALAQTGHEQEAQAILEQLQQAQ